MKGKILLAGALSALVVNSKANTIRFDQADRGPVDTLVFNDFTVTGAPSYDNNVATVVGQGLGGSSVGSFGSVDRIAVFNQSGQVSDTRESVEIQGNLTSVTLSPFFTTTGQMPPRSFSIAYTLEAHATTGENLSNFRYLVVNPGEPLVLPIQFFGFTLDAAKIDLWVESAESGLFGAADYQSRNGNLPATYDFGFSVVSLGYIPSARSQPVPDGGSAPPSASSASLSVE